MKHWSMCLNSLREMDFTALLPAPTVSINTPHPHVQNFDWLNIYIYIIINITIIICLVDIGHKELQKPETVVRAWGVSIRRMVTTSTE